MKKFVIFLGFLSIVFPHIVDLEKDSILKSLINPYNLQADYGLFKCNIKTREKVAQKKTCTLPLEDRQFTKLNLEKNHFFAIQFHNLGANKFQISFNNFKINLISTTDSNYDFDNLVVVAPYANKKINGRLKIYHYRKFISYTDYLEDYPHGDSATFQIGNQGEPVLLMKRTFVQGLQGGKQLSFNRNEDLVKEIHFSRGVKQGGYFLYHPNGEFQFKCNMVNNFLNGECQMFEENGRVSYQLVFSRGDLVSGYKIFNNKKVPLNLAQQYKLKKTLN